MPGMPAGKEKRTVVPRCAETKFRNAAKAAISETPTSRWRIRASPAPATSAPNAAARTRTLYAGLDVDSTMKTQATDHAATARALKARSAFPGRRRWRRRRVRLLNVVPTQRVFVVKRDLRVAVARLRPRAVGLDEQGPVGLVLRKALVEGLRLVVDLAHRFAIAERLSL